MFLKFNPLRKIPKRPPCLAQAITWIARLGGFLARKGDRLPGITHM
ncbi:MAG: hypothetical protein K0U59_02670 [Gammaproteobacteria bacterium]|nr:hypothetical protein [Gammaproteobacteria bacterium]